MLFNILIQLFLITSVWNIFPVCWNQIHENIHLCGTIILFYTQTENKRENQIICSGENQIVEQRINDRKSSWICIWNECWNNLNTIICDDLKFILMFVDLISAEQLLNLIMSGHFTVSFQFYFYVLLRGSLCNWVN